ncbi:GPP34 family phosphoprotein [Streptomyces sp. NPDC047017]|uniref:GOLPH3/VPS74 family protein n=1 Tax=Streptomyces sp. NPDC047017 TaxID=3155024 RepID=UPI0033D58562
MNTTVGEQILLLSLDDTTGQARQQPQAEYVTAAAALLELERAGRIRAEGDRLTVVDATPLDDPALDPVLARLAAGDTGGTRDGQRDEIQKWIFALRREAFTAARQALLDKGVLREEQRRVLGLFRTSRYPEADGSVEAELRRVLAEVLVEGREPDARTAGLVVLLHHGGLRRPAFPEADPAAVERRMAEIAEGNAATPTVRRLTDSVLVALASFTTGTAVGLALHNPS